MRILYDGQIFLKQVAGGINRYFQSLIRRLPNTVTPIITLRDTHSIGNLTHQNIRKYSYKLLEYPFRDVSYWFEKYYFRTRSVISKPDLVHPTYYNSINRYSFKKYRRPIVLTVHDMTHEKVIKSSHNSPFIYNKKNAILNADAIICVSENTKKDLLELYSIRESKVSVIYHGSEIGFKDSYGAEAIPQKPYYLYIGSRSPFKNFEILVRAFFIAAEDRKDLFLAIVGPPFRDEEIKRLVELGMMDRIIHFGYVLDGHLAKLYRCSIALVYPSLYEGFGIPLLEAMACKTVVIASNCSSIPEVVCDAGLLFDPHKVDELADMLRDLKDNESLRKNLIEKGLKRSSKFSWELAAEQTVSVYKSVL